MTIRLRKYLHQDLVYWQKSGSGSSGQSTYKAPVDLKCRWEDIQEEVQMIDGRKIISNAHVMLSVLVTEGSILFLGTIAIWKAMPTYPKIPTKLLGGYEVFKSRATPDFKGRPLLFEAFL